MDPPPLVGTASISASTSGSWIFVAGRLLRPVAVHVDRVQDALGQILLYGARSFEARKFRKIESVSQLALVYGRIEDRKP